MDILVYNKATRFFEHICTNRVTKWLITNNEKRCTVFTLSHNRGSIMHEKQPKDSVGDIVRISKADTTFQKDISKNIQTSCLKL